MADFSRYGGVSDDWASYMTANPQPQLPPDLTPVQLQERTNLGREANSREILKTITSNFHLVFVIRYMETYFEQAISKRKVLIVTQQMDR